MKKLWTIVSLAVAACFLLTATPVLSETTTLRWARVSPQRGYAVEWADWVKSEVNERTNGEVKIDFYWGSSLANMKEMPTAVKSGIADIGWIVSAYSGGIGEFAGFYRNTTQIFNVERDPVKFIKAYHNTMDEIPAITNQFKEHNMLPISCIYYDEYWIFSNKPVKGIEDFKGLKIRSTSKLPQTAIKAVGGSPIQISPGEMYGAIDKGIIDALLWSPNLAKGYKIYEVTNYITKISVMPAITFWCINLNTYNNLSRENQEALKNVMREADVKRAQFLKSERVDALELFKKEGLEVFEFPENDKKKMNNLPEVNKYKENWIKDHKKRGLPIEKAINTFYENMK